MVAIARVVALLVGSVVAPFDATNPFLGFFANPFGFNQHMLVMRTNPQGIPLWATTLASQTTTKVSTRYIRKINRLAVGCSRYFSTKAITLTKFNHVDNGTVIDWSKMYMLPSMTRCKPL